MEDKFLVYDYTKPDENESRRKLIEQRYWAQRMNKTTGEKHGLQPNNAPYGSTRNAGATYKASVLDYLNQKPSTPLSAGDILKLEELARTARNTNGKGNDWRPPSGLMGNSTPEGGAPLDAVQARDEYILRNGGVPPPSRPPPLHQTYPHSNYPNTTTELHHHHHKPSQEYSPTSYQTRRSSDDSYRIASSPDNSEYPLMGSVAALSEDYNIQQINNHLDDRNHTNKPLNKNNHNNISKMYSVSTISTNSSNTLHDNTLRSNTTSNTTTTSTLNNVTSRPPPARVSSIPRIHSNPLPPPSCLPPPIPSELPPLPPLPRNYI